MIKSFSCIFLLLVALVAARGGDFKGGPGGHGGPGGFHGGPGGPRPGNGDKGSWVTKLCANDTLAQSFLTQTRQLISNLQSNGSFTNVLTDRAQEIAYLENTSNDALLSSNCTGYFSGLNSARKADRDALELKRQYFGAAAEAFFQIIRSLVGSSGYRYDDF